MYDILIIRNGEVAIKGLNRPVFENKLIKNIEYTLYQFKSVKVKKGDGRIYVHLNGEDPNLIIKKIADSIDKIKGIIPENRFLSNPW